MQYYLTNSRWQAELAAFLQNQGIKVSILDSIRLLAEGDNIPKLVTQFEGNNCCKQKRHIHVAEKS